MADRKRRVGVLALQGAFEEHEASFKRIPEELQKQLEIVQVRQSAELDACDALVIPGGESTTFKIIAGTDDFMEKLRAYVHGSGKGGRPVWGTCAGCILLSDDVVNQLEGENGTGEMIAKRCKYGDPVGGLAVSTCRNFFGRQAESFEAAAVATSAEGDAAFKAFDKYPAVFIRAPAILALKEGARALAKVRHPAAAGKDADGVVVAAESKHLLVTCFHPELSDDSRIHQYFVERFVLPQP